MSKSPISANSVAGGDWLLGLISLGLTPRLPARSAILCGFARTPLLPSFSCFFAILIFLFPVGSLCLQVPTVAFEIVVNANSSRSRRNLAHHGLVPSSATRRFSLSLKWLAVVSAAVAVTSLSRCHVIVVLTAYEKQAGSFAEAFKCELNVSCTIDPQADKSEWTQRKVPQ